MAQYRLTAALFCFWVNAMLLLAVGTAAQRYYSRLRCLLSALLCSGYAALCTLPRLRFLGGGIFYAGILALAGLTAFGFRGGLRRCALFCLLRIAVDGIPTQDGGNHLLRASLLCGAGFLLLRAESRYVPVELTAGTQRIRLTALRDTGHTLRDPISGYPVLVVGVPLGERLAGLSRAELARPVETAMQHPGFRLLPCRTVTGSGHFLLAKAMPRVRIGAWRGSVLIAFAPEAIGEEGKYQALTGGTV